MARLERNPPPEVFYARRWPIFAAAVTGLFLSYLDVTIVNITLPELQREFDAGVGSVAWVVNAYSIAFAVLLVTMGRLADQLGRRRMLLGGLALFTLASLACALAPSLDTLIAARVLQGVGASVIAPLALVTTAQVFPPERRAIGVTVQGVAGTAGAVLGPPLGGVLIEYASWQWIFAINVPIGLGAMALAWRVLPESVDPEAGRRIDVGGMAALTGAVLTLSYALVEGNGRGWGSPAIVTLFAASALLTAAFLVSQRRGRTPMVPRTLAANREFLVTCASFLLYALGFMGMFFLVVLALVELWGYGELKAATLLLVVPLAGFLAAPAVARLAGRVPARRLLVPAAAATAAAIWVLSGFPAGERVRSVLPALLVVGFAAGFAFPATMTSGIALVDGQELGIASGLLNTARQLGLVIGVSLAAAVFTASLDGRLADTRSRVAALAERHHYPPARTAAIVERIRFDPESQRVARTGVRGPVERAAARMTRDAARDAFAAALRAMALAALLSMPLALLLRRAPGGGAPGV